jgi:hypothetical protein
MPVLCAADPLADPGADLAHSSERVGPWRPLPRKGGQEFILTGPVRLSVYIDGFNLYYGCLEGTACRWLDLEALCRRLFPRDTIHRIRYFTAIVSARPSDPQQPQRQQAYLRALNTCRWCRSISDTS